MCKCKCRMWNVIMASHNMKLGTKFLLPVYTFPTAPTPLGKSYTHLDNFHEWGTGHPEQYLPSCSSQPCQIWWSEIHSNTSVRRLTSSDMWHCVANKWFRMYRRITGPSSFVSSKCPLRWSHLGSLKWRKLLAQRHSITSQKILIFSNNCVRTSNLIQVCLAFECWNVWYETEFRKSQVLFT
jgi:hypothetical protein